MVSQSSVVTGNGRSSVSEKLIYVLSKIEDAFKPTFHVYLDEKRSKDERSSKKQYYRSNRTRYLDRNYFPVHIWLLSSIKE